MFTQKNNSEKKDEKRIPQYEWYIKNLDEQIKLHQTLLANHNQFLTNSNGFIAPERREQVDIGNQRYIQKQNLESALENQIKRRATLEKINNNEEILQSDHELLMMLPVLQDDEFLINYSNVTKMKPTI